MIQRLISSLEVKKFMKKLECLYSISLSDLFAELSNLNISSLQPHSLIIIGLTCLPKIIETSLKCSNKLDFQLKKNSPDHPKEATKIVCFSKKLLKFMFSRMATKIDKIFPVDLTHTTLVSRIDNHVCLFLTNFVS